MATGAGPPWRARGRGAGCGLRRRPESGARQPPFRRRSVAATSAAAAASSSPPLPNVPPPARRGARRVTRLAASRSHTQPAPHRVPAALLPLSSLHGSKCRRGQSGPKAKCSGRGRFISFHSFHQKINSQVLGSTVTAQGDDVAASEITRKGLDQ